MAEDLQALRRQIEEAFADEQHPGDDRILDHPEEWVDNPGYDNEYKSIMAMFRGRQWSDLQPDEVEYGGIHLLALSDAAAHYFLPGFMLADLGGEGSHTAFYLSEALPSRPLALELSLPECEAIAGFLRAAIDANPQISAAPGESPTPHQDPLYADALVTFWLPRISELRAASQG